jgi:hypothetical protein
MFNANSQVRAWYRGKHELAADPFGPCPTPLFKRLFIVLRKVSPNIL